jgi:hypothetical protein
LILRKDRGRCPGLNYFVANFFEAAMAKSGKQEWRLIKLPVELTTRVDAWALAHGKRRPEAVRYLLELALEPIVASGDLPRPRPDERTIEQFAESQIDRLIDPGTPQEERKRRIHRLTEGPPEFVGLRVDLPHSKKP